MSTHHTDWEKRFELEKRNWELYGPLGMGIAYPKLKDWISQERLRLLEEVEKLIGEDYWISELHPSEYAKTINEYKQELRSALQTMKKGEK